MGRFKNKIKPLFVSLSCSFGPPDKQLFLADHLESARQHKALGSASLQAASTQPQERVKRSQAPHICIISTCRGTRGTELFIKQICAAAACSERQGLQAVSPQHAHLIKEMAMFTCTHVCTHVLFPGEVQSTQCWKTRHFTQVSVQRASIPSKRVLTQPSHSLTL